MSRRITPAEVSDSRIDQAARREPKPTSGEFFGVANGHLVGATSTVHRNAEEAAKAAELDRKAARSTIRLAIARSHGCPRLDGQPCADPGHDDAVAEARLMLEAVGLAPYVPGPRRWYEKQAET